MPTSDWPSHDAAEHWEIESFINYYRLFPEHRAFEIIEKRERPDWLLRDKAVASSSEATPEKKTAPPSSAPLPHADDESLIDDVTEQELAQGITGYAIIGYRQGPARQP